MNTVLSAMRSTVFFLCLVVFSCGQKTPKQLAFIEQGDKVKALYIPVQNTEGLTVELDGNKGKVPILGSFEATDNGVIFTPLVSFTYGLTYTVWQGNNKIGQIMAPLTKGQNTKPRLIAIYPTGNIVSENLLKVYLQFSDPMRSAHSLDHVKLIGPKGDTLDNAFLNLQPELWDTAGKVLTLWLDPGRIKRDLAPNLQLGNPLTRGQSYDLVIDPNWKDTRGRVLGQAYKKHFTAAERDGSSPNINTWKLQVPVSGSRQKLSIDAIEPLDHFLLMGSVTVLNEQGARIKGRVVVGEHDRLWTFIPTLPWLPGTYTLRVNALLEDLAGNNLNRPFDRDIIKQPKRDQEFYDLLFTVK